MYFSKMMETQKINKKSKVKRKGKKWEKRNKEKAGFAFSW